MQQIARELQLLDDYLKLKNYRPATRKSYGCALKQFLEWWVKMGMTADSLDQSQARRYILDKYL